MAHFRHDVATKLGIVAAKIPCRSSSISSSSSSSKAGVKQGHGAASDDGVGMTRLQGLLPRNAAARLLQLATKTGDFLPIGCDSAEGGAGGAWADWAGYSAPRPRHEMPPSNCSGDEQPSHQSVLVLPRGSHLDEAAQAARGSGEGFAAAERTHWDWSWGWSEDLQRLEASRGGDEALLMREAMQRGGADSERDQRQEDERAELRWLVGKLEQRVAAVLGIPRSHVENAVLVKITGGARDAAAARSDGFHDAVSNAAHARCAMDGKADARVPPSFRETIFQETTGGPRTASLHLFLTDACSALCQNSSSNCATATAPCQVQDGGLRFPFLAGLDDGGSANSLRVAAAAGTALMWHNVQLPLGCAGPNQCPNTMLWKLLRNSIFINEPPKRSAGARYMLRIRIRARAAVLAGTPAKDDERTFLRNYDGLMASAIAARRADERLSASSGDVTAEAITTVAICIAVTTRKFAGVLQHIANLRKLQSRAVKLADAHDTRVLPSSKVGVVPSEAAARAVIAEYKLAVRRVLEELPLFKLLVPSAVRTIRLDEQKNASHRFRFRLYAAFDKNDPLMDMDEQAGVRGDNRSACGELGTLVRSIVRNTSASILHEAFAASTKRSAVLLRFDGGALAPKKPGPAFNFVTGAAFADGADVLVRVNDDTIFVHPTPAHPGDVSLGWPTAVANALLSFPAPQPRLGVTGPHCAAGADGILTHDATHRTHIDVFGHYYPPMLSDWWMDDWISFVYGAARTARAPAGWEVLHHTSNQGTRYDVDHSHRLALKHELKRGRGRLQRWNDEQDQLRAHKKRMRDAGCAAQLRARQRWADRIQRDDAFNASVQADIEASAKHSEDVVARARITDAEIVAAASDPRAAVEHARSDVEPGKDVGGACDSRHGLMLNAAGLRAVFVLHHSTLATRRTPMQRHLSQRCLMDSSNTPLRAHANHSAIVQWVTEHTARADLGAGVDSEEIQDPLRFLRPDEPLLNLEQENTSEDSASQAWANLRVFYPQKLLDSEVSIAVKHVAAWHRVANLPAAPSGVEPSALILEDDALLADNFRPTLASYLEQVPRGWGMLSLGGTLGMHVSAEEVAAANGTRAVFLRTTLGARERSSGAGKSAEAVYQLSDRNMFRSPDAYVLTRRAARALLKIVFPLAFAIDAHLNVLLNALALRNFFGSRAETDDGNFTVWWAEPTLAVQAAGDGFHGVVLDRSGFAFESSLVPQRERRAALSQRASAATALGAVQLVLRRNVTCPTWKHAMHRDAILTKALALDAGHAHVDQTHAWLAEVRSWQANAADLAARISKEVQQDARAQRALKAFRCTKWRGATESYEAALAALSGHQVTGRRLWSLHYNFAAALQSPASAQCDGTNAAALATRAAHHFRAAIAARPKLLSSRFGLAAALRITRSVRPAREFRAETAEAEGELRRVWARLAAPRAASARGGNHDDCAGPKEGDDGAGDEEQDAGSISVADVGGMLGAFLLESGRHTEAERILEGVAMRAPSAMASWLNLGLARQERGKMVEAKAAFERARALSPKSAKVQFALRQLESSAS
jgi:GR25 family glycosyltransferase involved in LPS biosynthesis/tetratricopeptide (TPR) repeat protein